ncbi:MAG: cyclic nucleotide-binding domain-containing protein [Caldilineaceae bacterium]|nr:cyclic nucleotide-binding domain-containing protein [Caldilineaceae bacterium]
MTEQAAYQLLLEQLPYLQKLPSHDVAYVLRDVVEELVFDNTAVLFHRDEPIIYLYLVLEGQVEEMQVTRINGRLHHTLHRTVGPGVMVGLYDLFFSQRYSTRAHTVGPTHLLKIQAAAIDRLIYRFPTLRNTLAPLHVIERLQTIPLFGALSQVELGFIADACRKAEWGIDELIYGDDDAAEWIYIIDYGQVYLTWPTGEERWLGNGAVFGFVEADGLSISSPSYGHTTVALGSCATFMAERQALLAITGIDLDSQGSLRQELVEDTLDQLPLLADFLPEQRQHLAGFVSYYHIPIPHLVIQQGELNDSLWVLMPGQRARIHALDASGQALQSTGAEGPNYFGEVALRAQLPADSTIEAEAGSQWLRLHNRDLEALSQQAGEDLSRRLSLRADIGLLLEREGTRKHHAWLQPGEFIDIFRRRHWLVLLRKTWPAQLLFWLIFLPGVAFSLATNRPTGLLDWLWLGVGILIVAQLIWGLLDYFNDFLLVTNRRVVRQEEVIFLKQWRQEAALEQIQNVDVTINFWGNLLGYGEVVVRTAGTQGAIPFDFVANPREIRDAIFTQRGRRQGHMQAESKGVIQRLLEGRLGLRLPLPSRVYQGGHSAAPRALPAWLLALLRWLHLERKPQRLDGNHLVWRKHWLIVATQLLAPLGIMLGIFVLLFGQFFAWVETLHTAFLALDLLLALIGLIDIAWMAWLIADWRNDTYEVNNESLVDVEKKPLFFSEKRRTARLGEIENIQIDIPSPLHYLLNFGNVRLQTAATQGDFTFDWVPDPRGVAAEIQRRIEEYRYQTEMARARQRAQELPDWFEMYNRLGRTARQRARGDAPPHLYRE